MKITLLADIHGNLPALRAVLRHARANEAAQIILNCGDSVGYGPNPNEVVRWIQGSHFINILGNYDKKVLSEKHQKKGWESVKTPEKRSMFAWTCQALKKSSQKFLRDLPEKRMVDIEGKRLLMTHGSPASLNEHLKPDTPEERLRELASMSKADVILCGHSHQAFTRRVNNVLFINPGSVGRSDDGDPRASYVILEVNDGEISVQHFRIPYHIMAAVRSLRRTGLKEVFPEMLRQGMNFDAVIEGFGEKPEAAYLEPSGAITLMTDFGLQDHFVGVMKGVIADIAPHANLMDLTHQIHPQDVSEAARMLAEAVPYFTPGTVHVAVVDPGVGTTRRALAARIGSFFYVTPDNGLLTMIIQEASGEHKPVEIIELDQPKYWLPEPSHTFHGRDVFAPVAAHLANGLPLEKLGEPINDPVMLTLSQPVRTAKGWQAEVVWVDTFGNLSTNLPESVLPDDRNNILVKIQEHTIHGLTQAFGDAPNDALIATIDSTGHLALAVVNGSAAEKLNADKGTQVTMIFSKEI